MSAFRFKPRVPLVALAIALAMAAVVTAQNADDAFRRGVDAVEDGRWQAAATALREAIKVRPQESTTRVRSGLGGIFGAGGTEYVPYFFLGRALHGAGDCVGAVSAWGTSEQHGVVQKARDYFKQIEAGYADCEKKGVLSPRKFDPAMARLYQLLDAANKQLAGVNAVAEANVEVWRAEGSIRELYDRAKSDIDTARARYDGARTSRAQRDIDAAAQALDRGRPILEKVEAGLRAAIDSRLSAQALARQVGDEIALAESLRTAVESKKVPFTPAMTASLNDGRDGIARARDRLADGQRGANPQALSTARTLAIDAQAKFRQLLDETARIEKEIGQRAANDALTRVREAFSLLDNAVATLDRFTADRPSVPFDTEERKAVQEQVARARRRLEAATKGDNVAAINDAGRLALEARDRLNILIAAFGPLTLRDRGVHAMLEQGARQYFAGEYQQAVASLAAGESENDGVALRLHFHLLRAAALYELFLRARGAEQGLEAQAREEVQHSKAIDSAFQPDARAFSPRFISFYASVQAPPVTAPAAAEPPPAPQP